VDWTALPGIPSDERNLRPDDVSAIAVRDLDGILKAEVFILLASVPEGRAKYAELGAAIMSAVQTGKPRIYVLGEDPVHSVFFFHPTVNRMTSLDDILNDRDQLIFDLPRHRSGVRTLTTCQIPLLRGKLVYISLTLCPSS
jgi:hypothetical protein